VADEIKNEKGPTSNYADNFDRLLPRDIHSASMQEDREDKQGSSSFTGTVNTSAFMGMQPSANILRNPARRFYDPEITTTAIYLPKDIKRNNRWCRWFYDHDEMIGAILDVHAELPYSRARMKVDDPVIQRVIDECIDKTNFFSMLPSIDLEYMKVGEVFIYTHWNEALGMWDSIVLHNPDFVEVRYSPFADREPVLELTPNEELRSLVHSTKPEEQQLKKRLPQDIIKRVLTGRNIILNYNETTHIARRSNPYDLRGTSIIRRLFRCFVPETDVRMSDGSYKKIEQIVVNDHVLSKNGEKRQVLDVVNYDIDDYLIELQMEKSLETLRSTVGHKYLVQKNYCACGCGEEILYKQIRRQSFFIHGHNLKFNSSLKENCKEDSRIEPLYKVEEVESQNIKAGDQLLVPINNEIGECNITEGQARLLGYFIAEGSFCNENTGYTQYIEFTFGLHEQETWAQDVIEILGKDFDIAPYTFPGYYGKKVFSIRIVKQSDYKKLSDFLNEHLIGRRAWTKEVTEKVLYYPKNIQIEILKGAFRGDGQYNKNYSEAIYCTTSKILAEQIQWLLFRCKYYNYIKYVDPKPQQILNNKHISIRKRYYLVRITGKYSKSFIKECWNDYKILPVTNKKLFDIIKKLKEEDYSFTEIANILNEKGYKGIEGGSFFNKTVKNILVNGGSVGKNYQFSRDRIKNDDDYFYVPVKEINKIKYTGKVYDITVDTNHWWLANGCYVTSNTLQYEDKLREAQLTISDNFIYPLKIFKLGDENKGWIPNASHQKALAQMLQQANFDPNFSLIYHYGLKVDVITVADKLLKMDQEWTEINKKKCMALGVSEEFLTKGESYAAANVGLQTQLARYKAKRDLFEIKWIRDKFFRVMAEKNGWYKRDAREIVGHYRVTRKGEELNKRIILPNIIWDKKLVLRDDQQYLTFLNNVYANGKGPVSVLTLLMAMGLTLDEELSNKEKQKELEEKFGLKTITPVQGGGGAPMGNLASKVMDKLKFGKKKEDLHEEAKASEYVRPDGDFVKPDNIGKYGSYTEADENKYSVEISKDLVLIDDQDWKNSLRSKNIPQEVITILGIYNDKLESIFKRSNGKFASEAQLSSKDLTDILGKIYLQGKLSAYESTNFLQVSRNIYAKEIKDFSDILLVEEFGNWITLMTDAEMDKSAILKNLRTLGNTCFGYGQLKGYQEQDIEKVKLSNVLENDGMKYEIKDLLSKRHNLSSLISPRGDIVVLAACIEESETVDSRIERYKDFISNGIRVSSCPVEFIRPTKQYLEKVGKVLKKKYDNIIFVKDIVDLPEWEEYTKKGIEKDLSGLDRDSRMLTLSSSLMYEKLKKRGNLAIFNNNKDLYIANWIGTQDKSIVDNFIKNVDIYQDVEKLIDKAFEKKAYDLTRNELETYRVFGYIEPVLSNSEIMGWKAAESRETVSNEKIRLGKIWNAEGICINNNDKDSKAFFFDNLKLWIEYTHKLDEPTVQSFNKIFF